MKIIWPLKQGILLGISIFLLLGKSQGASCDTATMDTVSASSMKKKFGFAEFGCVAPSNPPKYYFTQVENDVRIYDTLLLFDNDPASSGSNYNYYVHSETIDLFSGSEIHTCSGSAIDERRLLNTDYPQYDYIEDYSATCSSACEWSDQDTSAIVYAMLTGLIKYGGRSPPPGYGGDITTNNVCTATYQMGSWAVAAGHTNSGEQVIAYSATYSLTLSNEFTDVILHDKLVDSLPSYPTNTDGSLAWATNSSSTAFYHLSLDHTTNWGGKMKYRFRVRPCEKDQTYLVQWKQITTYDDTNQPPLIKHFQENLTGNGDPINGVCTAEQEVGVPTSPSIISVELEHRPSASGGGGSPGQGGPMGYGNRGATQARLEY